jgi:predicted HTH transcriptional regulator
MRETNRIELKSTLTNFLEREATFNSFSMPRNQEMMRIFKDLELVEHLGSGIPRILEFYPKECFRFTENFLRMTFPNAWDLSEDAPEVTPEVTPEVIKLVKVVQGEMSRREISIQLAISDEKHFRENYQQIALKFGLLEMTIPDKPNSRLQKYRLTEKGKALQKKLTK